MRSAFLSAALFRGRGPAHRLGEDPGSAGIGELRLLGVKRLAFGADSGVAIVAIAFDLTFEHIFRSDAASAATEQTRASVSHVNGASLPSSSLPST